MNSEAQSFDNQSISAHLIAAIDAAYQNLEDLAEEEWSAKPLLDKWSKKEILGHLLDSAANNHLRFVRAQLTENEFVSFAYEQNLFVSVQDYQNCDTQELLDLWFLYNRNLARVIEKANPEKLRITCRIGSNDPVSLGFLMNDYVDHMNHHLQAICS